MLKKAAVFALVCVSLAGLISCAKSKSHFVYASLPGSSQIAVFREDPNSGILTQISGSPFSSGAGPQSIAIHPSGKFLYAANGGQGENDLSLFTLSSDGVPTEVTPRVSVGSLPNVVTMDAAGAFLYVANSGSNTVSAFSIDSSSGSLSAVAGSPFPIGMSPLDIKLDPAGAVLYVTGSPNILASFTVSGGVLTLADRSSFTNGPGNGPNSIAIDPSGSFLYTANTLDSSISIFTIDSTGTFTHTAASPFGEAIGSSPLAVLADPTGKYLYVANEQSNNIAVYTIAPGTGQGALTEIGTSPFAAETQPKFLAVDPTGKYLLVGSQSSSGIQSFGVQLSTGTLNAITTLSTGNTPSSIVVIQ